MTKTLLVHQIMSRYHKQRLHKMPDIKDQHLKINHRLKKEGIVLPCTTAAEVFSMQIWTTSLNNKAILEQTYEKTRNELFDLWDTLDYQQRNKLIQLEIAPVKEQLPSFKNENQATIWICFFDELLNTLYHKETVVFELPQFFKIFSSFKSQCIDPQIYGYKPYQSGFIHATFYYFNEQKIIIDCKYATIFVIENKQWTTYPFYLKNAHHFSEQIAYQCAEFIVKNDLDALIDLAKHHELFDPKLIRHLNKYRHKYFFGESNPR